MPRTRLHAPVFYALLVSSLLIGCASTGADDADKPTLAEFDANLNQGVVLARILGLDGKKKEEAERAARGQDEVLARKLGVVVSSSADIELAQDLVQAISSAQADHAVTLIPAAAMAQQLSAYACEPDQPAACTERLAIYPGAQQLIQITQLKTTQDQLQASIKIHDTAHGFEHAAQTLATPAEAGRATTQPLRNLADQILNAASTAASETPWSTRAFKQEGSDIFLAAGERSGLKAGMLLSIHESGRNITSPTGSFAGWIPGAQKGVLKVTALFGEDYAMAELVEGQAPTSADQLLLQ